MRRTKRCFKCGRRRPLVDYYPHSEMADGHLNKCKACTKRDARVNYRATFEKRCAYELARKLTPARLAQRHAARRKHRLDHPDRARARRAVTYAVRVGNLVRQPCANCGARANVQAHHHDYSKPLDVEWLCRPCHLNEHGKWSAERLAATGKPTLAMDHARTLLPF